jgi:hypothetical protein
MFHGRDDWEEEPSNTNEEEEEDLSGLGISIKDDPTTSDDEEDLEDEPTEEVLKEIVEKPDMEHALLDGLAELDLLEKQYQESELDEKEAEVDDEVI